MATSDTYTLIISDAGVPSSHAASHQSGGSDQITVSLNQVETLAANTVVGNGTGSTAAPTALTTTGTGSVVRATGPTLTLTNATGLPLTTGVTGILPEANGGTGISSLAAGIATFLGTPTSANLNTAVTDQTGSGSLVFATGPTLSGPTISSPTISGTPVFSSPLSAANGGTGIASLGSGVATFLGTPTSANLAAAVTGETGTGALVFANNPSLVTPALSNAFLTGTTTIDAFSLSTPLSTTSGGTGGNHIARGGASWHYTTTAATQVLSTTNFTQLNIGTSLSLYNPDSHVGLGPTTGTLELRYSSLYSEAAERYFFVTAYVSIDSGAYDDIVRIRLHKYDGSTYSAITESEVSAQLKNSSGVVVSANMYIHWIVPLEQNEGVGVFIANSVARTMNIKHLRMTIHSIP